MPDNSLKSFSFIPKQRERRILVAIDPDDEDVGLLGYLHVVTVTAINQ